MVSVYQFSIIHEHKSDTAELALCMFIILNCINGTKATGGININTIKPGINICVKH